MVSIKALVLGPEVAYDSQMEVHCVIANARHVATVTDAIKGYIRCKQKKGKSEDEIVSKLENLETKYRHLHDLHEAFHTARLEEGLPDSKVLHAGSSIYSHAQFHGNCGDIGGPYGTPSFSNTFTSHASSIRQGSPSIVASIESSSRPLLPSTTLRPSRPQTSQETKRAQPWRRFLSTRLMSTGNTVPPSASSPVQGQGASLASQPDPVYLQTPSALSSSATINAHTTTTEGQINSDAWASPV